MKYAKTRLSLLMFIQYFIWGATGPIISLYLRDCLSFSGAQIGLVLGLAAVSAIVSPAIMTFLADRVISSERLLCLLNAAGGACMFLFSLQTEFYPALVVYIIYNITMNPSVPLINAITFHHSTPAEREKFGNIRVWGTIGWIAVAWFFSFVILRDGGHAAAREGSPLPLLLKISSITSFVMAAYSLTIPKDAGRQRSKREFFPIGAVRIICKPRVFALALIGAAGTVVDRFYNVGAAPFLKHIGFSERGIMPAMSLGQFTEIFAMGALALLLKRFGAKAVLLAGVAIGIFRFAAFGAGSPKLLIYAALCTHGIVYTFVMITVVICLDRFCDKSERAGVHQLFAVIQAGFGGFVGNYAAGLTVDLVSDSTGAVNYTAYWAVPLVMSILLAVALSILGFERKPAAESPRN
jgi:nucleoside transporter